MPSRDSDPVKTEEMKEAYLKDFGGPMDKLSHSDFTLLEGEVR